MVAAEEEVEEEGLVLSLPSEVEGTISLDDDGESLRFSSLSANARELMHILKIAHCCAGVVFGRNREGEDSVVGRDGLFVVVFPIFNKSGLKAEAQPTPRRVTAHSLLLLPLPIAPHGSVKRPRLFLSLASESLLLTKRPRTSFRAAPPSLSHLFDFRFFSHKNAERLGCQKKN